MLFVLAVLVFLLQHHRQGMQQPLPSYGLSMIENQKTENEISYHRWLHLQQKALFEMLKLMDRRYLAMLVTTAVLMVPLVRRHSISWVKTMVDPWSGSV